MQEPHTPSEQVAVPVEEHEVTHWPVVPPVQTPASGAAVPASDPEIVGPPASVEPASGTDVPASVPEVVGPASGQPASSPAPASNANPASSDSPASNGSPASSDPPASKEPPSTETPASVFEPASVPREPASPEVIEIPASERPLSGSGGSVLDPVHAPSAKRTTTLRAHGWSDIASRVAQGEHRVNPSNAVRSPERCVE